MIDLQTIGLERFQASAGEAAALLRALSNERRLMILCQLGEGELSVGQLLPLVGLSQSALSQHLARLRDEALVATRRDGTTVFYRIADPAVLKVIAVLAEIYCPPGPQEKEQA
ncbi:metalloregulator ArsR/SmtB family transcription factor [Pseudomonas sp. ODNR1LW]|nr:metalloregulator ArsR/SmtB family transcription factor [Pseudomonas sp. ODNR1LW]